MSWTPWWNRYPALWRDEQAAMQMFFPQFAFVKFDDGRIGWRGYLTDANWWVSDRRHPDRWLIQVEYEHNHPSTADHGSIRFTSLNPELRTLRPIGRDGPGNLPHVLFNRGRGQVYFCPAREVDLKVGRQTDTAATLMGYVQKWISGFYWHARGKMTYHEWNSL